MTMSGEWNRDDPRCPSSLLSIGGILVKEFWNCLRLYSWAIQVKTTLESHFLSLVTTLFPRLDKTDWCNLTAGSGMILGANDVFEEANEWLAFSFLF